MKNEILECIKSRRSVKKYKPTPVPSDMLDAILEAGTYAPTGRNMQSPVILAVTNKELRDRISRLNAAVMGMDGDPFYGAPVVIVVLAKKEVNTYIYDGSVTAENILLAAHALGLGACWIHRAREEFAGEEGKALLRKWGIKGNYVGVGHLILGYRDCDYPETRPRKENYIYRV